MGLCHIVMCSCFRRGDLCPSRSSFVVLCYCSTNFTTSHASWALAIASSFLCFSTNCAIYNFVSSFFHYVADFSASMTKSAGVHHFDGQDSSTVKITSSIVKYGNSCHIFIGSFYALVKAWWKSTLNFATLCRLWVITVACN